MTTMTDHPICECGEQKTQHVRVDTTNKLVETTEHCEFCGYSRFEPAEVVTEEGVFLLSKAEEEIITQPGISCAWCGYEAEHQEAFPFSLTHDNNQTDFMCSSRCDLRHRAYAAQCE